MQSRRWMLYVSLTVRKNLRRYSPPMVEGRVTEVTGMSMRRRIMTKVWARKSMVG